MALETIGLRAILEGGGQYISDLQKSEAAERSLGAESQKLATQQNALGPAGNAAASGLQKAGTETDKFGKNAQQTTTHSSALVGSLKTIVNTALGFTLGSGLLRAPDLFRDMATSAMEDEQGVMRLNRSFENLIKSGGNAGMSLDQLNSFMDEQIMKGQELAFSDDQIRDAYTKLLAATNSVEESQKRVTIAMDIARGTGMDLGTVVRLTSKITDESVTAFQRYGIVLEKGSTAAEAFAAMQAKFGGQAETYAKSTSAQFDRAKIAMSELKESLGYVLLPAFTAFAEGSVRTFEYLQLHIDGVITNIKQTIGPFVSQLEKPIQLFGDLPSSTQELILGFGGLALAIGPIASVLNYAKKEVQAFIAAWQAGGGIKGLATSLPGIAVGIGAVAVAVDLVLQKTTGHGIMDYLFGNIAKADAATEALARFNHEMANLPKDASAADIAQQNINRTQQDLVARTSELREKYKGLAEEQHRSLDTFPPYVAAIGVATDKARGAIGSYADELMKTKPKIETLTAIHNSLRGGLQEEFDAHVHYKAALQGASDALDANTKAAANNAAQTITLSGVTGSARNYIEEFTKAIQAADDPVKALEDAYKSLTNALSVGNPIYVMNQASLAVLNHELGDLKAKGDDATESEKKRIEVLEKSIEKLNLQNEALDRDKQAMEGLIPTVKMFMGPEGLGGLLTAMASLNVVGDDQDYVLGQLASAYQHLSANDIPGMMSVLEALKAKMDPTIWATIAASIGPDLMNTISNSFTGEKKTELTSRATALVGDTTGAMKRKAEADAPAVGNAITEGVGKGIQDPGKTTFVKTAGDNLLETVQQGMNPKATEVGKKTGDLIPVGIAGGIADPTGGQKITTGIQSLIDKAAADGTSAADSKMPAVGIAAASGVASGINSPTSRSALQAAVDEVVAGIKDLWLFRLVAKSPSRLMIPVGETIPAGIALGIRSGAWHIADAVGDTTDSASAEFGRQMQQWGTRLNEDSANLMEKWAHVIQYYASNGISMIPLEFERFLGDISDILAGSDLPSSSQNLAYTIMAAFGDAFRNGNLPNSDVLAFIRAFMGQTGEVATSTAVAAGAQAGASFGDAFNTAVATTIANATWPEYIPEALMGTKQSAPPIGYNVEAPIAGQMPNMGTDKITAKLTGGAGGPSSGLPWLAEKPPQTWEQAVAQANAAGFRLDPTTGFLIPANQANGYRPDGSRQVTMTFADGTRTVILLPADAPSPLTNRTTVPGISGGARIPGPVLPGIATAAHGMDYIPRDMLIFAHKGETVLSQAPAQQWRQQKAAGNSVAVDMSHSTFTGTMEENETMIQRVVNKALDRAVGYDAYLHGVR